MERHSAFYCKQMNDYMISNLWLNMTVLGQQTVSILDVAKIAMK